MIKNIVLSGCAFKCWAYIGTIRALSEYPVHQLEHVIGVSAGSFFGLLLILNLKWDFLLKYFINLNFKELYDIDIDNILIQQSIFAGVKFTQLIRELIGYRIDPDSTFLDLHRFSSIKLSVGALNITSSELDYFDYQKTPNVKLIDAIRASCCIPIIFPPYKINDSFYYDGGFVNNCPSDLVDEVDTIAFDLVSFKQKNNSGLSFYDLLNAMMKIINKKNIKTKDNVYNILGEQFDNEALNFNQSRDDIFNIYMHGYVNSKNILFKNYFALPSPVD
jgi:predicted acylesterase/phospholipase RssA